MGAHGKDRAPGAAEDFRPAWKALAAARQEKLPAQPWEDDPAATWPAVGTGRQRSKGTVKRKTLQQAAQGDEIAIEKSCCGEKYVCVCVYLHIFIYISVSMHLDLCILALGEAFLNTDL